MIFKKLVFVVLPFMAWSACAQDLPEFENYAPPPQLFDNGPALQSADDDDVPPRLLTAIEPDKKKKPAADKPVNNTKAQTVPKPPRKPNIKPDISTSVTVIEPDGFKSVQQPHKPIVNKPKTVKKSEVGSGTHLDGQRLVNPTARDVMATIEGMQATKTDGHEKISLLFMPGETVLTLDMKNDLLGNYVPGARNKPEARVAIQAYALPDDTGEIGARRISLARALETRDFLIGAGIESSRIDVMPLGNQAESAASDRVDVVLSSPRH